MKNGIPGTKRSTCPVMLVFVRKGSTAIGSYIKQFRKIQ